MKTTPATNIMRWLAALQQGKDTVTILGMNFMLLFGIAMGIAVPGLILYFMRWKLVRATGNPDTAVRIWAWSLVHEMVCMALFLSPEAQRELSYVATLLGIGYLLGVVFSIAGLLAGMEHRSALKMTLD